MKSVIIMCLLLFISIFCLPTISADPAIMISSYTLSPSILMPGDTALLTLNVYNAETTSTYSAVTTGSTKTTTTVEVVGADIDNIWIAPAYDGDKSIRSLLDYNDIGYIAPGATFSVNFELVADENISEGIYFPIVHVDLTSSVYTDLIYPIPITVSNDTVDLIASDISSKLSISGSTDVTLTIANTRNASVQSAVVTSSDVEGITISPSREYVGNIAAESTEDITFSLGPSIVGESNISFNLSYKNGINSHSTTLNIPVEVVDVLDVAPVLTSVVSSIKKGSSSRIGLEVYNAKTSEITGVIVTPITDATIIPSQYFIGSMDPDDVFSASFNLYTNNLDYGEHTIGFKVSFKQGNDYFETPVISNTFSVVSGDGATYQSADENNGVTSSNGMPQFPSLTECLTTLLIIIIAIIVVVVIYLKWKKRRKDK